MNTLSAMGDGVLRRLAFASLAAVSIVSLIAGAPAHGATYELHGQTWETEFAQIDFDDTTFVSFDIPDSVLIPLPGTISTEYVPTIFRLTSGLFSASAPTVELTIRNDNISDSVIIRAEPDMGLVGSPLATTDGDSAFLDFIHIQFNFSSLDSLVQGSLLNDADFGLRNEHSFVLIDTGPWAFSDITNVEVSSSPSPIPLPASAWLLLTALSGIGLLGWRRKRAAAVAA